MNIHSRRSIVVLIIVGLFLAALGGGLVVWLKSPGEDRVRYVVDDSIDEPEVPDGDGAMNRSAGVMVAPGGTEDAFVTDEVVIAPRRESELESFLARYDGSILRSGQDLTGNEPLRSAVGNEIGELYLVKVNLMRSSLRDLASNMNAAGFQGEFRFSSEAAARLVALLARSSHLRLGPNSLMRGAQVMEHPTTVGGFLDAEGWPWMTEDDDLSSPMDQGLSVGVTRAWEYLRYMGVPPVVPTGGSATWTPAHVAIVDGGFGLDERTGMPAPANADYYYRGGRPIQADLVDNDGLAGGQNRTSCTGGASCPWHGQGAFGVCCAVPRNRHGSAGTGGPVAIPMLIRVDWTWWGSLAGMYTLADAIRGTQFLGLGAYRASVVTISISGSCYAVCAWTEWGGVEDFYDYMQRAVKTAAGFGAIVVAAAGNESRDLDIDLGTAGSDTIPCELQHVICVGAIRSNGDAQDYSNYGRKVDIWAPTNILSTLHPDQMLQDANNTCDPPGLISCDELYTFGGTSAAAPFVAGVAALMTALDANRNDPNAVMPFQGTGRVAAISQILRETANTASTDPKVGPGHIDAYRAVARVKANQPPTISFSAPIDGAAVTWASAATGFFAIMHVEDPEPGAGLGMFVGDAKVELTSDKDGVLCEIVSTVAGQENFYCDKPELSLGQHELTAVATDPFGATGSTTVRIEVINRSPSARIIAPSSGSTLFADQVVQLRAAVTDPDEIIPDANIEWTSDIDGALGSGRLASASLSQGTHSIVLTATDRFGRTAQSATSVIVQAGTGHPSALIDAPPALSFYSPGQVIVFTGRGIDPEDGALPPSALEWSSDLDGVLGTGPSIVAVLSAPPPQPCEQTIPHNVTLRVADSDGHRTAETIVVFVGRIC